jgi:signal transduction histidine kinase
LLLFSRRQVMQSQDLDLNQVVTNLAKMLQRIIGEDVRLQLNLHPSPLLAHADAGMLDQVAMNLSVNARDAMPQGGQLVIATSEKIVDEELARHQPDAAPGRYVCLSVTDTGCGIAPEVLPRIFEPFFTTKETGKGTGLGLATVFGIVKQHRGWITVASQPGQGTTFNPDISQRD